MQLDDGQRTGPPVPSAISWRSAARLLWSLDERGGDELGEINLSPDGPPGPQASFLIACAVADRTLPEEVVAALVLRPYPVAPRDGDGMRVEAVRGAAAFLLSDHAERRSDVRPVTPSLRARLAPTTEEDRTFADWFEWLFLPRPRWTHDGQEYLVQDEDRWLMLVGLVRSTDAEAFTWYRSGLVLLDTARALNGRLNAPWRDVWASLLEVRPGPRDWRDWQDALLDALRS